MAITGKVKSAAQRMGQLPVLRHATSLYYERQFKRWPGAFRGVFASFAEAAASAPGGARVGYDFDELGTLYQDRLFRVFPADYPVLFWLSKVLEENSRVFDLGGHVGLAFHAFARYLSYPRGMQWTVQEVPSVVQAGRRVAEQRPSQGLHFTSSMDGLAACDVLHSAGAIQYIEKPLWQTMVELGARPQHLIINKLPLYEGPPFVTLQNTLHSYNPYQVFNRTELVSAFEALGYRLLDSWENVGISCHVPFHPAHQVPAYSGLYFRRGDS